MRKRRCRCGSSRFERVDMTAAGASRTRYFIRCSKCGLVVFVSDGYIEREKAEGIVAKLVRFVKNVSVF